MSLCTLKDAAKKRTARLRCAVLQSRGVNTAGRNPSPYPWPLLIIGGWRMLWPTVFAGAPEHCRRGSRRLVLILRTVVVNLRTAAPLRSHATQPALLERLSDGGYGDDQLSEIRRVIDADKSDVFDVLAYIAFALPPITREERVQARRARIFSQYDGNIQAFLDFELAQYIKEGVGELDQAKLPDLLALKYRAIGDATEQLGGAPRIREAFVGFQRHLYE
jgi:hypothetical protein